MKLHEPNPVYDAKEKQLLLSLTEEYLKFIEPKKFNKQLNQLAKNLLDIVPNYLKNAIDIKQINIDEHAFYQKLMETLANGFGTVEKIAANFSINEKYVLKDIQKKYPYIDTVDKITFARSYDIKKIVKSRTTANYVQAFVEGAATGAPGIIGLPFNIVLSTFLYYRVVQNIAMFYGYDVKNDPKELEFAGEVFITAFTHGSSTDLGDTGAIIGKIMMQSELTALRNNVSKMTLKQLAEQGGIQLLYVQIRALAHKVAGDAIKATGNKSLEKSIFKNILKTIGKNLPKKALNKTIPVIGGFLGALFDTAYMDKVIKAANLIYHKRFLLEKEIRIKLELNHVLDFSDIEFEEFINNDSSIEYSSENISIDE